LDCADKVRKLDSPGSGASCLIFQKKTRSQAGPMIADDRTASQPTI